MQFMVGIFRECYFVILVIIALLLIIPILFSKKNKWVSTDDFEKEKKKLRPNCSDMELQNFLVFLKKYQGGYVRRKSGQIVHQDFLGKEKGDLKGIFFNIVVPNPNISTKEKEEFRRYLKEIGVNGIDKRPNYETRDSKLRNNKKDEEYIRKEVGNIGEQIVRNALKRLEELGYSVIKGTVLKYDGVSKEYDHIVIGDNGVFCIETKAFGLSGGKACKASLFIDPNDKWIIRKNGMNRDLESPTQQVVDEKKLLEKIINLSCFLEVHPILVLCNTELYIKNNIELPYDVVRIDALIECIQNCKDSITESDRLCVLSDIDRNRIN